MSGKAVPNALIHETSPYLLQHAHNPVAWNPWGEAAIECAKKEAKPILLSIGYSACHWCHVMAHESFEDQETAAIMNELFINIKVDREERPDIDKIYQTAHYMLTQRPGGWPLTMFLTPDTHTPFFGGTYFPPAARYGMPGFKEIMHRVSEFYQQKQDVIQQQNRSLMEAFERMAAPEKPADSDSMDKTPLEKSRDELTQAFDEYYGGFGTAPKFPMPVNIERLLHEHELNPDHKESLAMAAHTLRQMALGGIYDQIGGGFCRYSVDEKWLIPHYEKMLYDNGPLLALYADTWHISHEQLFRKTAEETADWLIREMQSPDGGFYSSLDADSEGEEGKFYLWTADEAKAVLNTGEYDLIAMHFGLDQAPNFEGKWHFHINRSIEQVADAFSLDSQSAGKIIRAACQKLYTARKQRIWPGRDEKILTSWNALAIKGLSVAALRFHRQEYRSAAGNALDFIHDRLWQNGRLLATYKDNKAHLNAYLDDYAFLIDAILSLLQTDWSNQRLNFAVQLADRLLENFYDDDHHGFFFTSHDHEKLIQRRKDFTDDALPSGNGIAAMSLVRLGHLISEPRYIKAGEMTLNAAWYGMQQQPSAHHSLLLALEDYLYPLRQIILRGEQAAIDDWKKRCFDITGIRTQIYAIPDTLTGLPEALEQKTALTTATAYVCEGMQCLEPITDFDDLQHYLK